jgi:asparagine synthase (glutamine-hydrolysing)
VTKWLLRQLLYKRVPPELVDRPKMGFGVPLRDWLRGPLHDTMREYMASDDLQKLGLDPTPVRTLWDQFTRGRYARADLLWQIFILSAWSRRYVHSRVAAAGTGITENDRTASMTRS